MKIRYLNLSNLALFTMLTINLFSQKNISSGSEYSYFGWDGHKGNINSISINKEGTLLASGGRDATVRIMDVYTGRTIVTINDFNSPILKVCYSPDGKTLATADDSKKIVIWNTTNWIKITEIFIPESGTSGVIKSLYYSNDGKTLLATANCNIYLFETNSYTLQKILKSGLRNINCAVLSSDSRMLAACGSEGIFIFWSLPSYTLLYEQKIYDFEVQSITFSPDDKYFATVDYSSHKLWRTDGFQLLKTIDTLDSGWAVSSFIDGNTLLASGNGKLKIYNIQSGKLIQTIAENEQSINSIAISNKNNLIAASFYFGDINIWTLDKYVLLNTFSPHSQEIRSITCSNDGKYFATGSYDGQILIWDALSGSLINKISDYKFYTNTIKFSPDNKILVSGNQIGAARIWQLSDNSLIKTIYFPGDINEVKSAAFSHDGKLLAIGGIEYLKILNLNTLDEYYGLHAVAFSSLSLDFSPDGKTIINAGRDGIIEFFDIEKKEIINSINTNNYTLYSVQYSQNGSNILSAGFNIGINIYNTNNTLIESYQNESNDYTIALFFKNDNYIAGIQNRKSIDIFSTINKKLFKTIYTDLYRLNVITISPDGRKLYCGGRGYNNIRIYDLDQILRINNTDVPKEFKLFQNYPNPFNPATIIKFELPKFGHVELKVFDILGREVRTLLNENKPEGIHYIRFDGSGFPSGIYYYQLKSGNFRDGKKMIYLK